MTAKRSPKKSLQGPIAAAGTDPGRERENNEDRTLLAPEHGIYAVVDGVGGESGGEVAAQMAVDVLRARLSRRTTDTPRLIREAIALANKQIFERAQAEPALQGMSCVLTVAVLDDGREGKDGKDGGGQVTVGHVGDSRLYLLRRGSIRKVTRDHSPVGMREDAGEISELEAMHHPRRNEIFRDVGSAPHEPDEEGFIEIHQLPFDPESALLLCSDGLSDLVTSAAILDKVEGRPGDPDAAVRDLIAAANAAGGKDNISIVLVEGPRFAAGPRRRPAPVASPPVDADATTERTGPVQLRRAASAKPSAGERLWNALTSSPALLLYALAALAVAAWLFRAPLQPLAAKVGLGRLFGKPEPERAPTLHVDVKQSGPRALIEALDQAEPGQTIEVAPGEYEGPVVLQDGVSLVSQKPRGAVIRLPQGVAEPAVSADGIRGIRFIGFRIVGSPEAPLAMGLRLADSAVDVENVEISGASTAGLELAGADRSAVSFSFIHDNPGVGVIVRGQAAPRLQNNLIHRNGTLPAGQPAALAPGVEIREEARPQLIDNKFEGNGAAAVWVPAADRADEILGFNTFGNLPKDKAVRVSPRPGPAVPPAPTPAPQVPEKRSAPGRPHRSR